MYYSVYETKKQSQIVATDSEWDSSLPDDKWISTCFASEGGSVVFLRDDIPETTRTRLDAKARELGLRLEYVQRTDASNLLTMAGITGETRLAMFYSPKDVEYAVGWEHFKNAIDANKVRQRNNLSGKIGKVFVKDLFGWAGKAGLLKFADTLGVPMKSKDKMDEYKSCMWRGLMERPEDYLRYAIDDAGCLLTLHSQFVSLIRTIQGEILGMSESRDLWRAEDIPMTCGALVAKTFERWLYAQAGDYRDAMKFAVRKLGLLDPDAKNYKGSRWAYEKAVAEYRSVADLRAGLASGGKILTRFMTAKFLHTGLDSCGVKWWAGRPITETACLNALVQGGRCQNENPFEYEIGCGLDVDISGCYGESLRSLVYPVGLPSVWSYTTNETPPRFGEWLDANEKDLADGLWCAVVSGNLPFEQDQIFSKLVKVRDIRRAIWTAEQDDSDIPADFVLLRTEIRNGIITADILRVLRAVASKAEWGAIRDLEMTTAVAYRRQDRRDGVTEWCKAVMEDYGKYRSKPTAGTTADLRTRVWFGVPMEGFVGRLVDERKRYKASGKDASLPEEERLNAQGLDGLLKLLVNTLYGDFTSRYFPIGNTILGNNITARARMGVWMLAKALGLRQSITDGGIYTPDSVCRFKGARPGLDILSRSWEWSDYNRGRGYCPMGGLDWTSAFAANLPDYKTIDALASEHVRDFWSPYGLIFPFRLEHKQDNTFRRAAYWSKADYALQTDKQHPTFAVRGKDKNKRTDRKQHPTFALLESILAGKDVFPDDLRYTKGGIMKVGKWRIVQESKGYEDLKGLRPGDNLPDSEYTARYNNTHFPLLTEQDFLHRRNRHKTNRGMSVAWFERYGVLGISGVHNGMIKDKLRG